MIPRLPFDRPEAAEFLMLVRIRGHKDNFARVGDYHEQRLVAEQQHLPAAVAPFLPASATGLQVDACQDATVEAIKRVAVHHEVVE